MDKKMPRLVLVGDVASETADPEFVMKKVTSYLQESAISCCNCEWALTDRGTPWPGKAGRVVRSDPSKISLYSIPGFDVVSLANNHIMNYGAEGLEQTLEVLDRAGIKYCGAGANLDAAHRPAIVEWKGTRIAFLSYTSVYTAGFEATPNRPGMAVIKIETSYRVPRRLHELPGAPLDVTTTPDSTDEERMLTDIRDARELADIVVVLMHWGVSMGYQHLVPYQIRLGHAAVDAGADLVVGHHPHTVQGVELYNGKTIAYSLAHFGFDMEHPTIADEAILLEIALEGKALGQSRIRAVGNPLKQPELLDVENGRYTLDWLRRLSRPLGTDLEYHTDFAVPVTLSNARSTNPLKSVNIDG
jgi:poly-gamma-glutamate synthesis protein (capsule biosynthesis protein)